MNSESAKNSCTTPMATEVLKIGGTATASLVVGPNDLESAMSLSGNDTFPAIFATARLISLMEIASARILRPCLKPGQLSVGAAFDVTHTVPTPLGANATAVSKYLGPKGKLFEFEIVASDQGGEIGSAKHSRAIVDVKRLVRAAEKRTLNSGGSS
jgi:fluoroacetyl-CoA thioesterase